IPFLIFLFFTLGRRNTVEPEIRKIYGDVGENLILPCKQEDTTTGQLVWRLQGRGKVSSNRMLSNGSLFLKDLSPEDNGNYTCKHEDDNDTTFSKFEVKVRTPPPALVNVTVIPSTILALLRWDVEDDGGYPITHFTAQYRLRHTPLNQLPDPWHSVTHGKIAPTASQIDVYELEPNSSYVFQVWANNKLGLGEVVELEAITMHDPQEIELGRHLLQGAQNFDTRIWVAAVAVVMGTLVVLATATVYALYRECRIPLIHKDDHETMELIPNIILNPGYQEERQTEWLEPDENSNDRSAIRLNNNTVINPVHM
ncbi:hypothetical protein AAG570_000154, partial [Ranatra chinensis]